MSKHYGKVGQVGKHEEEEVEEEEEEERDDGVRAWHKPKVGALPLQANTCTHMAGSD